MLEGSQGQCPRVVIFLERLIMAITHLSLLLIPMFMVVMMFSITLKMVALIIVKGRDIIWGK